MDIHHFAPSRPYLGLGKFRYYLFSATLIAVLALLGYLNNSVVNGSTNQIESFSLFVAMAFLGVITLNALIEEIFFRLPLSLLVLRDDIRPVLKIIFLVSILWLFAASHPFHYFSFPLNMQVFSAGLLLSGFFIISYFSTNNRWTALLHVWILHSIQNVIAVLPQVAYSLYLFY